MRFDLSRADTICAVATATAPAAIAVVRVSGARADDVRTRIFSPHRGAQRPFAATLGNVRDSNGELIDEALCVAFPSGRSYTGEASFELSLHGGPLRVQAALNALVVAGCRLAEPGEFTLRAVLTGRLDLCAAEAVHDVIHARTDAAARAALRALRGGLAERMAPVRGALVDALAEIEARLDFPDEELGATQLDSIAASLRRAAASLDALLGSSTLGQRLAGGARVVLYGPPNAGKSTLLNALLGEERALVHDEPGTTRDVLEAPFVLGGVAVTLVDVAGVRPLTEAGVVERLGIERALGEKARADIVVTLVPAPEPDAVAKVRDLGGDVLVLSQHDRCGPGGLPSDVPDDVITLSARTGLGLEALLARLTQLVTDGGARDEEVLLMHARQVEEVRAARQALEGAHEALESGAAGEVVASELRRGARALDRLLGRDIDVDVLDLIFSRFCIGK